MMKTYLALTAAALVAMGGTASAKTQKTVITLDGYCDVITLRIDNALVAAADAPKCTTEYGAGMIETVKGFGNSIVAGLQTPNSPGHQYVVQISYPLVSGGAWTAYSTTDGVTLSFFNSGTYTVKGSAARGVKGETSVFQH